MINSCFDISIFIIFFSRYTFKNLSNFIIIVDVVIVVVVVNKMLKYNTDYTRADIIRSLMADWRIDLCRVIRCIVSGLNLGACTIRWNLSHNTTIIHPMILIHIHSFICNFSPVSSYSFSLLATRSK